jgi:hypothetical protein
MKRPLKAWTVALTAAILGPIVNAAAVPHAAASTPALVGYVPRVSTPIDALTTATGQTFLNPDGTRTLMAGAGPVRFQDATTGAWTPIDLTVTANPNGSLTPKALPGGPTLDATTGAVTLTTSAGPVVIVHAGAHSTAVQLHERAATWPGLFGDDRALVETLQTNGSEEAVTLPSTTDPASYTDELTLPTGVTARNGNGGVELVDQGGTVIGGLGGGYATDANNHEGFVRTQLGGQVGQSATVTVSLDATWLSAATAPVTIDPTLYTSTGKNGVNTYISSDNCLGAYYYEAELRVGGDSPPTACAFGIPLNRAARTFLRFFDVGSVAASGSTVVDATVALDQFATWDNTNSKAYLAEALSAAPTNATNWSNQPNGIPAETASFAANGWHTIDVTNIATSWIQSANANVGLAVVAAGEADTFSLKKFYSANAGISVGPQLAMTYAFGPQKLGSLQTALTPLGSPTFHATNGPNSTELSCNYGHEADLVEQSDDSGNWTVAGSISCDTEMPFMSVEVKLFRNGQLVHDPWRNSSTPEPDSTSWVPTDRMYTGGTVGCGPCAGNYELSSLFIMQAPSGFSWDGYPQYDPASGNGCKLPDPTYQDLWCYMTDAGPIG